MNRFLNSSVLILIALLVPHHGKSECNDQSGTGMRTVRHCISLGGVASGGTLMVLQKPGTVPSTPRYVSVETMRGEPAERVVERLACALRESGYSTWANVVAEGVTLKRLLGVLGFESFAGTETGLGIPQPPLNLSGCYNAKANQVTLRWDNPPSAYDVPMCDYNKLAHGTSICLVNMEGRTWAAFHVIGIRNGIPSNYAVLNVSEFAQEELECLPFYNGIMPNWSTWSTSSNPEAAKFEQKTKQGVDLVSLSQIQREIKTPQDKPFFQLITTSGRGVQAGVWRKFLGLSPGRTYRLHARLNTLAMDEVKAKWSYSLHAAYNAPGGADLGTDQLAGDTALPDGSKGLPAGRIVQYGVGSTTKGNWIQHSTGDSKYGIRDIKLPVGVDTITVWVRHSGENSTGVGIDWVRLEDVTEIKDSEQR